MTNPELLLKLIDRLIAEKEKNIRLKIHLEEQEKSTTYKK